MNHNTLANKNTASAMRVGRGVPGNRFPAVVSTRETKPTTALQTSVRVHFRSRAFKLSPNLNRSRLSLFGFLDLHGCSDAPLVADQNNGAICAWPRLAAPFRCPVKIDKRRPHRRDIQHQLRIRRDHRAPEICAPEACTIVFPDVIVNVNSSVGGDVAVCTCTTTDAPVGA